MIKCCLLCDWSKWSDVATYHWPVTQGTVPDPKLRTGVCWWLAISQISQAGQPWRFMLLSLCMTTYLPPWSLCLWAQGWLRSYLLSREEIILSTRLLKFSAEVIFFENASTTHRYHDIFCQFLDIYLHTLFKNTFFFFTSFASTILPNLQPFSQTTGYLPWVSMQSYIWLFSFSEKSTTTVKITRHHCPLLFQKGAVGLQLSLLGGTCMTAHLEAGL